MTRLRRYDEPTQTACYRCGKGDRHVTWNGKKWMHYWCDLRFDVCANIVERRRR